MRFLTSWSTIVHLPAETEIVACRREIISGVVFDNKRTFVSLEIILPKVIALFGKSKTLFGQKESFSPLTGTVFLRQASYAITAWASCFTDCLPNDATMRMLEQQDYLAGGRQSNLRPSRVEQHRARIRPHWTMPGP